MEKIKILKSSILVLGIANLANVVNYAMQFTLSRALSTEDYGIFNTLGSMGSILASTISVIPLLSSQALVKAGLDRSKQAATLKGLNRTVIRFSLIFVSIIGIFSQYIASFLKIPAIDPIFISILSIFTSILVALYLGYLSGLLQHIRMNVYNLANAIVRYAFAVVLVVFLNFSYRGAISAGVFGNLITLFAMFLFFKSYFRDSNFIPLDAKFHMSEILKNFVPLSLNWFAITAFTNLDLIFVKHLFDEVTAGLYSGAAVIGRIATFLPLMLVYFVFPEVSSKMSKGESSLNVILLTLGLTGTVCMLFLGLVYLFPQQILTLLLGNKFIPSVTYLFPISMTMSIVSLIGLLSNVLLAQSIWKFLIPVYFCLASMVFLIKYTFNSSPLEVIYSIFVACVTTLFLLILYAFKAQLKNRHPKASHEPQT